MSLRDFPLRYEMMGGSLKISLNCGWFSIRCHFPMSVSFRLGNAGWYCVIKGSVFLGAVLFFCAKCSTIFNQLNIWEQAPGANNAPSCVLTRAKWYWSMLREQNPSCVSAFKLFACVQTSPISFVVPFPRVTEEIGDVCTQAIKLWVMWALARK